MKTLFNKIFFGFMFSFSTNFLFAQTIEEQMTKSHPNCQTMLRNAMDIIPVLYKEKKFDSLDKAISLWENSCSGMPEVKITRILFNMETAKFNVVQDVDGATLEMLNTYAKDFSTANILQNNQSYNETLQSFYKFSAAWAMFLLENKKLDENEIFICKVLKGEIKYPQKVIEKNTQPYPEYEAMLQKYFEAQRNQPRINLAFSTGVWLPTKNLSVLGIHPSFGMQAGIRSRHQQLDFTFQFRYLESANTYAVKIDGRVDSTDYYFGGYIGADYTYYFVSKTKYEFGILAGMGWDGFDFAPHPYTYYYDDYYTSHETIGSFNANAGLRFNYFFTHSFYVGLQGRYNAINYSTHGGTYLSGDAITIDLIFGFNGSNNVR